MYCMSWGDPRIEINSPEDLTIENLPVLFGKFPFSDDESKKGLIHSISVKVTEIFVAFLTKVVHGNEEMEKKFHFVYRAEKLPTAEQVADFESNLQTYLEKEISEAGISRFYEVSLVIDYSPVDDLYKILDASGIKNENLGSRSYPYLFPCKFGMVIRSGSDHISVRSWQHTF